MFVSLFLFLWIMMMMVMCKKLLAAMATVEIVATTCKLKGSQLPCNFVYILNYWYMLMPQLPHVETRHLREKEIKKYRHGTPSCTHLPQSKQTIFLFFNFQGYYITISFFLFVHASKLSLSWLWLLLSQDETAARDVFTDWLRACWVLLKEPLVSKMKKNVSQAVMCLSFWLILDNHQASQGLPMYKGDTKEKVLLWIR